MGCDCVLPVVSCCVDTGLLSDMKSWEGEKGELEAVSAVWTPWASLSEDRHGSSSWEWKNTELADSLERSML